MWSFACPDWFDRLKEGRSLVPDLPINEEEGARAVKMFNKLRLPDVPGQPAMKEAAGEWIRDIVRAVFGSIDPETGDRRVREVFALVPKKNSKTTSGAGIMLVAMLMNERPRAEFILVGPTQEVADIAYQQLTGMIAADPDGFLQKRFHVIDHHKAVKDRRTGARLKIKTFDMKVMVGAKPAGILFDEIHAVSGMSFASRVVGQMRGGLLPNPEGFLIMITTQSDEAPAGTFKAELHHARAIRDGKATGRLLPILYEFPVDMQTDQARPWRDPANWPMVLPNLGRSIRIETLVADYEDAQQKGDEEERRWASQHLNVEIGMALHADNWPGAPYWPGAALDSLTLEEIIERSDVLTVGADGGGLDDLFGLCVCGRDKTTREWLTWHRAWAQSDVFERRKDIAERLRDFVTDGDLIACEDPTQDIQEIADIIERLQKSGKLAEKQAVGLDPVGVAALVDELDRRGISEEQMVAVPQGYRLSGSIWGSERKLKDGTLWHCGSPMMTWCVGNAKVEQRGNAVLITKQVAGKSKIDPLIAMFNAVALMSRNPEAKRPPTYQMIFA